LRFNDFGRALISGDFGKGEWELRIEFAAGRFSYGSQTTQVTHAISTQVMMFVMGRRYFNRGMTW
jgi:hypothetical protein